MVKNYLLVAFRNLFKNKIFTIINIVGLGVALAVCIVAFFNHMFNYEFDRTHVNFDQIYRVNSIRDMELREQEYGIVPATLGLEARQSIPGIEKSARIVRYSAVVKKETDLIRMRMAYVDPEFLDIFTFPLLYGDKSSIGNNGEILISKTAAEALFRKGNPLGKSVTFIYNDNKELTFTVGGVFKDLPDNSSFRIDILSTFDNWLTLSNQDDTDWKMWVNVFFIMVKDRSRLAGIENSLKDYIPVQNKAREDFRINRFVLVPLKDVGSNSRRVWSANLSPSLHPAALLAPPVMATFILLIACFNFANTSRSIFSKRLKEIGLRKTFGGQRRQLVGQFMLETIIICALAILVAIIIAEFLVPAYSSLWSYMTIELTFTRYPVFWFFTLVLLLVTGFISGVFPALYVSSFNPVNVFKGETVFRRSGKLSLVLLTLQFSISVMALVLGIVFAKNAAFQNKLDLGFDRDKLIVVPVQRSIFASLRNEALSNPKVISAEGTQNHIGYGAYRRPLKSVDKQLEADVFDIGPGYASAMGLDLLEGRLFDEARSNADITNHSVLVNRKLVSDFGWSDPIGETITIFDTLKYNVIGVLRDFYANGLWVEIEPVMLELIPENRFGYLVVRANPGDLPSVLDFLAETWKTLAPNMIFSGQFQEDLMQEGKDINNSILKVNIFLAFIATLLSLIGMYNLVSLDILRRTKEVGIRKIQGAPVPVLMFLISRKFLIILVIASVAGCVGGYYMSSMLMGSIWKYYVDIKAGVFISASAIMILATSFTVTMKIIKAVLRNPADSLRYE